MDDEAGPRRCCRRTRRERDRLQLGRPDGAIGARREETLDGIMDQMRFDPSRGHPLTVRELLDSRLAQSGIEVDEAMRDALAESLADVDHERERRERAADEAAHPGANEKFDGVIAEEEARS